MHNILGIFHINQKEFVVRELTLINGELWWRPSRNVTAHSPTLDGVHSYLARFYKIYNCAFIGSAVCGEPHKAAEEDLIKAVGLQ